MGQIEPLIVLLLCFGAVVLKDMRCANPILYKPVSDDTLLHWLQLRREEEDLVGSVWIARDRLCY